MGDNDFYTNYDYTHAGTPYKYKFDIDEYGRMLSIEMVEKLDSEIMEDHKMLIRKAKIESLRD